VAAAARRTGVLTRRLRDNRGAPGAAGSWGRALSIL